MTDNELRALIERECGPVQRISDMLWAVEVAKVAIAAERERCADIADRGDDGDFSSTSGDYDAHRGRDIARAIRATEPKV